MNKMRIGAALLAAPLAFAPLYAAAPAEAGGSVTITVTPKGKKAEKLKNGLERLAAARERRNRARIDQNGTGNTATVSQNGGGNTAGVFQRGKGHTATATQDGNNNALGIFQFGKNTSTNATQTGDGKSGVVLQIGW